MALKRVGVSTRNRAAPGLNSAIKDIAETGSDGNYMASGSRAKGVITPITTLTEEKFYRELPANPVLIVTATKVELRTVLFYLRPMRSKHTVRRVHIGKETYYLGRYGVQDALATMCGMGAIGRDSAMLATHEAVTQFAPKAIFMIGIAFGRSQENQAIGDVLVASQVISYEPQRISGDGQIIQRGPIAEAGPTLLNRFHQALDWVFIDQRGRQARMLIGPILSGEKLVDQSSYRRKLFERYPQAIGGEMEGVGIYAVAARSGVEWIIVKGICDWADGNKTDDSQQLAAASAASLVHYVLSEPTALMSLSNSGRDKG